MCLSGIHIFKGILGIIFYSKKFVYYLVEFGTKFLGSKSGVPNRLLIVPIGWSFKNVVHTDETNLCNKFRFFSFWPLFVASD